MKKNMKYWSGIIITAGLIIVILIYNKSKLEAGIIKEKNSDHTVVIESVKLENLNSKLNYTGTTEAVNDIELISETAGKVEKVFVENGDCVSANAAVVKVDDQILQANYKLAEAALDKAKLDFSRFEKLLKEGNLSVSDLENSRIALKNAEAQHVLAEKYLSNALIKCPISGRIVNRYVNKGGTVAPGTPVANIVDISRLKIKINMPEKDFTKIKTGEIAAVTCSLFPGKAFEAKVKSISIKADESHNYLVELLLDNFRYVLSAGMYVNVEFNYSTQEKVLSIPRVSLTGSVKNPEVYVIQNGKAVKRNILIGGEIGDKLIVLNGLDSGENVVTEGQNNLQDGSGVVIKTADQNSNGGLR
jgi:membrane fusion protein, multidrug efflux system